MALMLYEQVIILNLATKIQTETDPGQKQLLKDMMKRADEQGYVKTMYKQVNDKVGGRLYALGGSLQNISKETRAIISVPAYDVDLVNAHPTLLAKLCKDKNIPCPVLLDYIQHRTEWRNELVADGDDEETVQQKQAEMKVSIIASIYGSAELIKSTKVMRLREELATITKLFLDMSAYKELHAAVKLLKPRLYERKHERTFMSYLLQREEVRVVGLVLSKLKDTFKSLNVQSYIYDGFLIRKEGCPDINLIISAINEWVAKDEVAFELKVFDCPLSFAPMRVELLPPGTDVAAIKYLCTRFPGSLKMWGSEKMVYSESDGRWLKGDLGLGAFYNLSFAAHTDTGNAYGTSKKKMGDAFNMMLMLEDESQFFEEALARTKGKLLFSNCIYDKLAEHRLAFSSELYFPVKVPHALPDGPPPGVDEFQRWMFESSFPEPGVSLYYKHELMRAIFGIGQETATFHIGSGSNGKSQQADAMQTAFGELIVCLDGKHLVVDKHASASGAAPHLMVLQNARIVLISEIAKEAVVNIPLLKTLTGGDKIAGRQLYGQMTNFRSYAKLWFLCNNIPGFSECGNELTKRIRQLDSNVQFLLPTDYNRLLETKKAKFPDNNSPGTLLAEDLVFPADEVLSLRCKTNSAALIWLLVNQPLCDVDSITPDSVKVASLATVEERDNLKKLFDEQFMDDREGRISTKDLQMALGITSNGNNDKTLANRMASWGFGRPRVIRFKGEDGQKEGVRSGYLGVRKRTRDNSGGGDNF